MSQADLLGTWRLVSFELRLSSGQTTYPFGKDAHGLLVYDAGGNFSVQLGRLDRPWFASGDMLRGTAHEMAAAYNGYIAYCGTYVVDKAEEYLTHQVRLSLFPNWNGRPQRRYFELSGGTLTLSTPPTPFGGHEVTGVLVWERAG